MFGDISIWLELWLGNEFWKPISLIIVLVANIVKSTEFVDTKVNLLDNESNVAEIVVPNEVVAVDKLSKEVIRSG